jgi:hypothetical protein
VSLLASLEESPLGIWIRESEWGYPIVLICHTVGMAFVVGGVVTFDLRILLAKTRTPLTWFDTIFRLAWLGFAVNLVSGIILFAGAAQRFIANPAFQIKLASLAAGAFSVWLLATRIEKEVGRDNADVPASPLSRTVAAASVLLWFGAISAGRLMAYIR